MIKQKCMLFTGGGFIFISNADGGPSTKSKYLCKIRISFCMFPATFHILVACIILCLWQQLLFLFLYNTYYNHFLVPQMLYSRHVQSPAHGPNPALGQILSGPQPSHEIYYARILFSG